MTSNEKAFERELEILRKDCESAAQFFYGHMAMNEVAKRRPRVLDCLNRNALFWVTASGAMQSAAIMAMGRSFDQTSPHNIDRVIRLAQDDPAMFSESALRRRKQGEASTPPSWLDGFVRGVYVPGPADFRRLRAHVRKHRRIYESNYRDLRHKIYAHNVATEDIEIQRLISRTNVREIERLLLFLMRVYESLWHLFMNGRKPTLRALRCSVKPSGELTLPRRSFVGVHRRMARETEDLLTRMAAQPAVAPDGRRPLTHRGRG
ncbi:MAG: hypothetical protein AB1806_07515 [Acidobacteriota bacterium]